MTEITWQYDFLSEPSSPFKPESPMGNSFVPGLPARISLMNYMYTTVETGC